MNGTASLPGKRSGIPTTADPERTAVCVGVRGRCDDTADLGRAGRSERGAGMSTACCSTTGDACNDAEANVTPEAGPTAGSGDDGPAGVDGAVRAAGPDLLENSMTGSGTRRRGETGADAGPIDRPSSCSDAGSPKVPRTRDRDGVCGSPRAPTASECGRCGSRRTIPAINKAHIRCRQTESEDIRVESSICTFACSISSSVRHTPLDETDCKSRSKNETYSLQSVVAVHVSARSNIDDENAWKSSPPSTLFPATASHAHSACNQYRVTDDTVRISLKHTSIVFFASTGSYFANKTRYSFVLINTYSSLLRSPSDVFRAISHH